MFKSKKQNKKCRAKYLILVGVQFWWHEIVEIFSFISLFSLILIVKKRRGESITTENTEI